MLGLIDFNGAFHRWEKWNQVVHVDFGSRSKIVGLGWKSPSNDFQDPREYWGDAQRYREGRVKWTTIFCKTLLVCKGRWKAFWEQSAKERKVDQWWDIHPSDPLRNGPGMKTQRKLSRWRWSRQRNVGNAEDIIYAGTAQRGNIKRATATKFLDFRIRWKLRTSRRSSWKLRGLVLNVQSK